MTKRLLTEEEKEENLAKRIKLYQEAEQQKQEKAQKKKEKRKQEKEQQKIQTANEKLEEQKNAIIRYFADDELIFDKSILLKYENLFPYNIKPQEKQQKEKILNAVFKDFLNEDFDPRSALVHVKEVFYYSMNYRNISERNDNKFFDIYNFITQSLKEISKNEDDRKIQIGFALDLFAKICPELITVVLHPSNLKKKTFGESNLFNCPFILLCMMLIYKIFEKTNYGVSQIFDCSWYRNARHLKNNIMKCLENSDHRRAQYSIKKIFDTTKSTFTKGSFIIREMFESILKSENLNEEYISDSLLYSWMYYILISYGYKSGSRKEIDEFKFNYENYFIRYTYSKYRAF